MSLSDDVPDSTDWIPTSLPAFEPLEAALRCEVCKEFYTNPVITTCSHTFCSLCIRRCISDRNGQCPACKSPCQADRLLANIVVREVVGRFKDARGRTLELARADKQTGETSAIGKKRKVKDTDLEDNGQVRQTRARQTRTSRRGGSQATADAPVVVSDSEAEEDEEYVPEGMARCPICSRVKTLESMYEHVDVCTPEDEPRRSSRSRKHDSFSNALSARQKDITPAMTRLSGLNYAMLKDTALKKKLKELGIPQSGSRNAMIRRHTEWLNIWNSNCDADDNVRKTQRELLRELESWERTQGGSANTKESHIMRKDFDGAGYASTHKNQFDDLIANARKRIIVVKKEGATNKAVRGDDIVQPDAPQDEEIRESKTRSPSGAPNSDPQNPYAGNESALASIRHKVNEANSTSSAFPPNSEEAERASLAAAQQEGKSEDHAKPITGFEDPFASPSRKMPMFALPTEPVVDVDNSAAIQ